MQKHWSPGKTLFSICPGLIFLLILVSSCGNTRQITYLQGKFDTAKLSVVNPSDPVIQKGDILSVIVYSDNPQATAIYNQSLIITASGSGSGGSSGGNGSSSMGGGTQGITGASPSTGGYMVDEMGNIQFQGLGLLHVEGLKRSGLKELLDSKLKEYLKNPYYTIRFLNYKFTILGEVSRQGVYNIPGERLNLLEAFGLAGDLTFYGRRDNILVIRVNDGKREFARLDLTKPEVMNSPFFYLQQNDVVYVEPSKKKVAASDQLAARNISIATSIIATLILIYSVFRK